jgi:hypothetical protein
MRPKLYYPKYQIQENLYTDGEEYQTENGEEYIGMYHKYLDGTVLTGAIYDRNLSKKLVPFVKSRESILSVYDTLVERKSYVSPYYSAPRPTKKDYDTSFMLRFFLRRRNSRSPGSIIEIDSEQFTLWQKPKSGISEVLYDAIQIEWKLTGPEYDVVVDGKVTEFGVSDTNKRILNIYERNFPGLRNYLTLLTEYSEYDKR